MMERFIEKEGSILTEAMVARCANVDALVALLRTRNDVVPGSSRGQAGSEVARRVEQVRHGYKSINFVTEGCGIRTLLELLLPNDSVYRRAQDKLK